MKTNSDTQAEYLAKISELLKPSHNASEDTRLLRAGHRAQHALSRANNAAPVSSQANDYGRQFVAHKATNAERAAEHHANVRELIHPTALARKAVNADTLPPGWEYAKKMSVTEMAKTNAVVDAYTRLTQTLGTRS